MDRGDRSWRALRGPHRRHGLAALGAPREHGAPPRRRHESVPLDDRLGPPRDCPPAAVDLRRQHLLPAATHAGLLGERDRQRAAGRARARHQRQSGAGPERRAAAGVRALRRRHVRPRAPPRDEPGRLRDRRPDLRVQPAALSPHRAAAPGDDSVAAVLPRVAAHVPQDRARASRMVGVRVPRHRAPHERPRHHLHPARVARPDRLACGVRRDEPHEKDARAGRPPRRSRRGAGRWPSFCRTARRNSKWACSARSTTRFDSRQTRRASSPHRRTCIGPSSRGSPTRT